MKSLLFALLFLPLAGYGQCDSEEFLDNCASKLGTFTFIKSFDTQMKKTKPVEYSYIFSKGSTYKIVVCDQDIPDEKMIVNLYDRNKNLIVSSYSSKTKKHYPDLEYPCSATGVYYIEVTFESPKGGCGLTLLGFKKG